jgi:hypothetical protein
MIEEYLGIMSDAEPTGISPDETVGLYMPNSIAYVESLLGCWSALAGGNHYGEPRRSVDSRR